MSKAVQGHEAGMVGVELMGGQVYFNFHCFVTNHSYFQVMKKITIDLTKWATAKQIAKEKGWDNKKDYTQRVTTIVNRFEVKTWKIDELGIRLIDRDQFNKVIPK